MLEYSGRRPRLRLAPQLRRQQWNVIRNAGGLIIAVRPLLLIIVIILLIGALPSWPYSSGWGYYPAGGLGTILVIVLILFLLGVI